ncbi:xylulokinase [Levilactobacillus parabrevis]|uniref:L-ribulokinase n=1 Tax=Levilactobacillus parabrevis ATCC 53295 TaxID=1267003 RepID=A0A0R1GWE3_9LACO|nr:FGGY-family carbohydrate kinase [Levilactobacillus parabrevis]KRK36387.1 L-ribulokinase [Levilactobacillus parabrevis ATCC 53295]KRO05775.1 L-ribulokinase [Levilactobacillus parabrevis]MCT4487173.1 ATPase [Levilactobacillus parabrevis]MCT4490866.1 ATPase [Levilactobacillus parabrevis]
MNLVETTRAIEAGEVSLGIELGSTRIKAVLVTDDFNTIASGSYVWENRFEDGVWTYPIDEVWTGIQQSYTQMAADVQSKYHSALTKISAVGVSAMMHGYLAFDKSGKLLVPFRTWRNNITEQSADELTKLFDFNIPQRWSIAHLYQAILNGEDHVRNVNFITSLAGYVTWKLSGEKVLGVGDASGVFPIDDKTGSYDKKMLEKFSNLDNVKQYPWDIEDILPDILPAGKVAGHLTAEGASLLDANGNLEAGSVMAPPEGDAGTGMVGTNSVRKRTGNISVGTSSFSMNVLDKPLTKVYRDIDIVMTPDGSPVAMVHINNCSSDINAWASVFNEFAARLGVELKPDRLYETLFLEAAKADPDAGGLVNYSYQSGENITKIKAGRPLFVRTPNSKFSLPNFMQTQLYAAFAPLKIGMDILINQEHVHTDVMIAQGGLFRTPVIGQQVLANALNVPITVMSTAGEGGPWGMAVLAVYAKRDTDESLEDFLDKEVFTNPESMTLSPEPDGVAGYQKFIEKYQGGLPVEAAAGDAISD